MLSPDWFKGKRVTVMGLGLHGGGLSSAKWLVKHGAIVTVTDMKDQHALAPTISDLERYCLRLVKDVGKLAAIRPRYVLGRHDDADFSGVDMVIRNPAVPREHPLLALAVKNGVPVETDVSVFFQLCPYPIAAVSGTKGKTTTTTLLANICKAWDNRTVVGGNIRISPLDALDRLIADDAKGRPACPVILELSSWHLESLERHKLSPHVGVLTNIREDHLNRYAGIDDYAAAKAINVAFQRPDDIAVLNAEDSCIKIIGAMAQSRIIWFSTKSVRGGDAVTLSNGWIVSRINGKTARLFPQTAIRIPGDHNIGNVLAATAAALALGVPATTIKKAVAAFRGVPGRLETAAMMGGVRYVNDTTATAPDAGIAAMVTYAKLGKHKKIILIAGGADKELTFDLWAKIVKANVKHLILFDGAATVKMEAALAGVKANIPAVGARNMREAVDEAARHAKRGDVVLLSPGCASFGTFQHEFDRGDQFMAQVKRLARRKA